MGNRDTTKSQSPEKRDAKIPPDRSSEATSQKTVSDLEESEKASDSGKETTPSPDGTPISERGGGRADGSDTGGPM